MGSAGISFTFPIVKGVVCLPKLKVRQFDSRTFFTPYDHSRVVTEAQLKRQVRDNLTAPYPDNITVQHKSKDIFRTA